MIQQRGGDRDMKTKEMRVRDLMHPDVKTVEERTTLLAAAKMMRDLGVSSLMIKPENEKDAYGIITRKDIVEEFVEEGVEGNGQLVEDAMTKPAIAVNPELSIYHCQKMMQIVGVRRMPVVEGTDLVGIISNSDIFSSMMEQND